MRFVILTQYYPPEVGAAQVRLHSMARELLRRGHDVLVVTAMPSYPTGRVFPGYRGRLWYRERLDNVPVLRTWAFPSQSARIIPRMASYLSFTASALATAGALGRPDFLFVESPPLFLALTGRALARATGARWMMNVSDLWPDSVVELGMIGDSAALRLAWRLEIASYRAADFVVAVTEGIRASLRERKGVPDRKVLFLPNGVDTELFQPRPPDPDLLQAHGLAGKSVFLFAGTLNHAQDIPNIIEASALLRDRPDIAVVFIGDGPVRREAEQAVARRALGNVSFVDPQPLSAMPGWWSVAHGALVTLKDVDLFRGTRPAKSFPALASGVPILYAGRGEWARILTEAHAGLVVDPGVPEALAAGMRRLADEPELARSLGACGRSLAEARFSWRGILSAWLDELQTRLRQERSS